jgi:hypothetical protein
VHFFAAKHSSATQITIHQAKGLEFPTVFIPRFNEGTIPLDNRISDATGSEQGQCDDSAHHIQEERRLAFVALSRAKSQLFVSWVSKSRFGEPLLPSRFIEEIPSDLMSSPAVAPSDTPVVAFPQCSRPIPRANQHLPPSSTVCGSLPLPMASECAAPAPPRFMGAFRKASDVLADYASAPAAHRKQDK